MKQLLQEHVDRIIEILSKVPSPDPLYDADMITLQGDVDVLAKFNDMGVK